MTLQERLRESAKELVRLLEEDLEAKKWMPESRKVAQMNVAEARRFLQRINLKEETELEIRVVCRDKPEQNLSIDNGKAFEAREYRASIKQSDNDARVGRCRKMNDHALADAVRIYESLVPKGAQHARLVLKIAGSFKYPLF